MSKASVYKCVLPKTGFIPILRVYGPLDQPFICTKMQYEKLLAMGYPITIVDNDPKLKLRKELGLTIPKDINTTTSPVNNVETKITSTEKTKLNQTNETEKTKLNQTNETEKTKLNQTNETEKTKTVEKTPYDDLKPYGVGKLRRLTLAQLKELSKIENLEERDTKAKNIEQILDKYKK